MGLFDNLTGKGKSFSDSLKYVDDFKTELVRDEKGKLRKKTTYIGVWTVLRESGKKTLLQLITAAILSGLCGIFLVWILLLTHASSGSLFVILPLAAALFPALYAIMGAFSLPYRQKPMRRDQYMHSFVRMQRSAVAILAFVAVGIVCSFGYRIVHSDWLFFAEDATFLGLAFSVIVYCVGVLWLLGRIETAEYPNSACQNE